MAEPDDLDDDLFADLYEGDENEAKATDPTPAAPTTNLDASAKQDAPTENIAKSIEPAAHPGNSFQDPDNEPAVYGENIYGDDNAPSANSQAAGSSSHNANDHGFSGTVGIKEDGKMFIGGLNWETTDQSLRDYFSQFGDVVECTVMRDSASGRSRGFGFLTFKDPKTVNIVMVKEHYLDGKIIDPKRAIPRDEQEKTSKIFVGGVSQEATERDFEQFFAQFGRVIDATLMMDKDTGRPRGFGFVTFEGEAAVEATLAQPLEILGKPIEVKKAQPRGNLRDEEDNRGGKFGRRGQNDKFGRQDNQAPSNDAQQNQGQQNGQGGINGMSPQMMAQYWQRMQQYFAMMQQQMAANMQQGQAGMGGNMNMGGANPAMMQQMMAMQQQQQQMNGGQNGSPGPQSPGAQQGMGGMNPAMMQQMAQMQQMQQMQQQAQNNGGFQRMASPMNGSANGPRPAYTAQEQLAFEQQKYEQQQHHQQRRGHGQQGSGGGGGGGGGSGTSGSEFNSPGPQSSWEGMYDDVPPPNMGPQGGGRGRGGHQNRGNLPQPTGQAPANAPTGPKNAGKPGANYRGGGRGGHRGFHPYARN